MFASKPRRFVLPKLTERLTLGEGGLRVSPFCLGMVRSEDTTSAAFDAGINFFFLSADLHWPYYDLARGLRGCWLGALAFASRSSSPW